MKQWVKIMNITIFERKRIWLDDGLNKIRDMFL